MASLPKVKIPALEKAAALINAGETIKAKLKDANDALGREYSKLLDANHTAQIKFADTVEATKINGPERGEFFRANDLPFNLHQVNPAKHKAIFVKFSGEDVWKEVETLVDTRAALKALPIVTIAPKEISIEEKVKQRVLLSFKEQMAKNNATFNWAKAVIDEMNKELPEIKHMPVSINHVYCQNFHGTSWLRIDWFFDGRKTPFNIIAAAAQEIARKKESETK